MIRCPCDKPGAAQPTRKLLVEHIASVHGVNRVRAFTLACRIEAKEELEPGDYAVLDARTPHETARQREPERPLPDDEALNRVIQQPPPPPPKPRPVVPPPPQPLERPVRPPVEPTPPRAPVRPANDSVRPANPPPRGQAPGEGKLKKSHMADPASCRLCAKYAPEKCGHHGGPKRSTAYGGSDMARRVAGLLAQIERGRRAQQDLDAIKAMIAKAGA